MKKMLSLILALALVLCLAACGEKTPAETTAAPQQNDAPEVGMGFTYKGTKVALNAEMAPILAALGEPISYTEEASCAFEGLDKTYYFGSFYVQTYPMGDKDYVFSIWFADDGVTTDEGVYVGAPQAEVEAAYGAENYNGSNAYIVTEGKTTFTVILEEGKASSIQYDLVLE